MPAVSVIMPTYLQASFIRRALESLLAQSLEDWELLLVDDGSTDETCQVVEPYLEDPRIHYFSLEHNQGLGAALNYGLGRASAPLMAYLPSDDVYYHGHLASLVQALKHNEQAVLAYSGVRYSYNRQTTGKVNGQWLQLVQVMHRLTPHRWVERDELVTDDLDRMFWAQLHTRGAFIGTGEVTSEWVSHPHQRSRILREPVGGIQQYKQHYGVKQPLRYHSSVGNAIDEVEHYRRFRERSNYSLAKDGLKVLLVGELAYNPERVLALAERGHQLFGLWMPDPYWYNMVGPLPFGHVQDVPRHNWQQEIRRIKPDVIYALLNWQAVPFAHHVLEENPGIPFIWHFKEGPFISLEKGHWKELVDLHLKSDGQVYSSPEMMAWFNTIVPGSVNPETSLVLDGDLPKQEWFTNDCSPRLSDLDGAIHTVVPGRPIGLHPQDVVELAEQNIHLHFYGDFTHGQWLEWIEKTLRLAPVHIHLHRQVDQEGWVKEFSKYDAGWLHYFRSNNFGELRRANWDDLNYPARIPTLLSAGLPLLQYNNRGHIVAAQKLASDLGVGLFFKSMEELRNQFHNPSQVAEIRRRAWEIRKIFTFDYHADRLVAFFHRMIDLNKTQPGDEVTLATPHQAMVFENTTINTHIGGLD